MASWLLTAVFLCLAESKAKYKAEQNTKQSTSKDKEASATTGCKDSEPKAKKERAFNEAWRKEFDWLMYDDKSGKIAYIFQMVKTSSLRFVAGVKIFSWMA